MNDLQTLFTIVFGVYFATTVATASRFSPFDTTACFLGDKRALRRLLVSFALLDFLPFLYFLLILWILRHHDARRQDDWGAAVGVLFAGLGGFGIYRLFVAAVSMRRSGTSVLEFYSTEQELANEAAKRYAQQRLSPDDAVAPPSAVLAGGVAWLLVCMALFLILVSL